MAKKTDTDFGQAATPRGQEEPLSGALSDALDTPAPCATDEIVDGWFSDCVRGGPIGRHTPSFNHIQDALAELKRRLNEHSTREN